MKYTVVRGEGREYYIVYENKVIATCRGWEGPLHAQYIMEALNDYKKNLYDKFELEQKKEE